MKWLPREKRNAFVIVVIGTLAVLVAIYFGIIRVQYASLAKVARDRKAIGNDLQTVLRTIKNKEDVETELTNATSMLSHAEQDMASGDLNAWTYSTMRLFKSQYKVEIPETSHPSVGDVDLIPAFP